LCGLVMAASFHLTVDDKAAFEEFGFVVHRGLLSEAELNRIREVCCTLRVVT
jgi:hypothetical protein